MQHILFISYIITALDHANYVFFFFFTKSSLLAHNVSYRLFSVHFFPLPTSSCHKGLRDIEFCFCTFLCSHVRSQKLVSSFSLTFFRASPRTEKLLKPSQMCLFSLNKFKVLELFFFRKPFQNFQVREQLLFGPTSVPIYGFLSPINFLKHSSVKYNKWFKFLKLTVFTLYMVTGLIYRMTNIGTCFFPYT